MESDKDLANRNRIELDLPLRPSWSTVVLGVEGGLAGDPGHKLSQWMAEKFNENLNEYDKAIDAVYNDTHIGGAGYHHLIDGQHDIFGAFAAARDVRADDGFAEEAAAAAEHLLRDTTSVSGINPFFSLTESQFNEISDSVASLGISKAYLADALMVNVTELLAGGIALCYSFTLRKRVQKKELSADSLSRLAGGCLLSSVVSANPALMPIAAFMLVDALRSSDSPVRSIKCAGAGALVTGSALVIPSIIGGPLWFGCLTSVLTASLVSNGLVKPKDGIKRCHDLIISGQQLFASTVGVLRNLEIRSTP